MPVDHYENFPVASYALPAHLRRPVAAIYAFARAADDIADEGEASPEQRLRALDEFESALSRIEQGDTPGDPVFSELAGTIRAHSLPLQPFRDLLSAFRQDVTTTRYASLGEVMDYCRRSANPVGRLLMALFGDSDARHLAYADGLCSSLQLINFLQDVAIDFDKGRIYLPQDDLAKAGLSDALLGQLINPAAHTIGQPATMPGKLAGIPVVSALATPRDRWRPFMLDQVRRVRNMLQASAPLGLALKGRAGLETRMIIAGGERILRKLHADPLAPLSRRVTLSGWDWSVMLARAVFKR